MSDSVGTWCQPACPACRACPPPTLRRPTAPSQLHRHQDSHPRLVDCGLLVSQLLHRFAEAGQRASMPAFGSQAPAAPASDLHMLRATSIVLLRAISTSLRQHLTFSLPAGPTRGPTSPRPWLSTSSPDPPGSELGRGCLLLSSAGAPVALGCMHRFHATYMCLALSVADALLTCLAAVCCAASPTTPRSPTAPPWARRC